MALLLRLAAPLVLLHPSLVQELCACDRVSPCLRMFSPLQHVLLKSLQGLYNLSLLLSLGPLTLLTDELLLSCLS